MSKKKINSYLYDFKDKETSIRDYMTAMFNRTQSMFYYENLPDTVPQRELERLLQEGGFAVWTKVNDDLYCFTAGLDGQAENAYFDKSWGTIANAPLNFSKTVYFKGNLKHEQDAVLMRNDSNMQGLWNVNSKYSTLLTETDLTIYLADIMSRATAILVANDDKSMLSSKKYLEDIQKGNLGVIAGNLMYEAVNTQPYINDASKTITDLIELEQYIKASWFNHLGLNANYNMKREALNSGETAMNTDVLRPLIDDMLNCRERALEEINELWGLDIKVKLSSSWEIQEIKDDYALLNINQLSDDPTNASEDPLIQSADGAVEGEDIVENSTNEEVVEKDESEQGEATENEASIDINININEGEKEEEKEETEEKEEDDDE